MSKLAGILASGARRNAVGNPPTTAHRYWRLLFQGVASGDRVNITEAEFLDARFYRRKNGTFSGSGQVSGAVAVTYAHDGLYTRSTSSEFWSSNTGATPIWFKIDAGIGQDFICEGITLCSGNITRSWTSIDVQWSDDDSAWTTEWTIEDGAFSEYDADISGTSGTYQNAAEAFTYTNPNIPTFVPVDGFNKDGILVWLKSYDGAFSDNLTTPAVDGDPVQTLTNHAGGSLLLRQSTLANRPIFREGGAGGLPYLEFDRSQAHFLEDVAYTMAAGSTSYERTRIGFLGDVGEMPNAVEYAIIGGTGETLKSNFALRSYPTGRVRFVGAASTDWTLANGMKPPNPFGLMSIGHGYGAWALRCIYFENAYGRCLYRNGGGATVTSTAITSIQLFRSTGAQDLGYFNGKVYELIIAQDNTKSNEFGMTQAYHIQQYLKGRSLVGMGGSIPQGLFLVDNDGNNLRVGTGALLKVTPDV